MNRPKEWVRLNCERILRPRAGEEKSEEWKRGDWNCGPVWELWFRPGVREGRLRFSYRRHRASGFRWCVAKTYAEAARFPDARAQSIDHRRNRLVCNCAYQKNDKRRFARSVGARTDAYSLHAGLLHPFIRVRGVHDFCTRHLCIGNWIDNLRRHSALLERRALRRRNRAAPREEGSFDDASADAIYLRRQIASGLPLRHKKQDGRLIVIVVASSNPDGLHFRMRHQFRETRIPHGEGTLHRLRGNCCSLHGQASRRGRLRSRQTTCGHGMSRGTGVTNDYGLGLGVCRIRQTIQNVRNWIAYCVGPATRKKQSHRI